MANQTKHEGFDTRLALFRVETASPTASERLKRCLILADALQDQGVACHFVCGPLEPASQVAIETRGFTLLHLRADDEVYLANSQPGAAHDGSWRSDADETGRVIAKLQPEFLILDHPFFDQRWQEIAMEDCNSKLLVVSDKPDRRHRADILLDHGADRCKMDYAGLVPEHCQTLCGLNYALMPSQFARHRADALSMRAGRPLRQILLTPGGNFDCDATSKVLQELRSLPKLNAVKIEIMIGSLVPNPENVMALAAQMNVPCRVHLDADDQVYKLIEADLAFGLADASIPARCALGLASLFLPQELKEYEDAKTLAMKGAGLCVGDFEQGDWQGKLREAITALREPQQLQQASDNAAMVCDGDGALRVVDSMLNGTLVTRPAERHDARRIWDWRHADGAHRYYRSPEIIDYALHREWYLSALKDAQIHFAILMKSGCPIGYLRLDLDDQAGAFVSICLDPCQRNSGLGFEALELARSLAIDLKVDKLLADIHQDNSASLRLFEKSGYTPETMDDAFCTFSLQVNQ